MERGPLESNLKYQRYLFFLKGHDVDEDILPNNTGLVNATH